MERRKKPSLIWRELQSEKSNWINIMQPEKSELQRLGRRIPFFETIDLLEALPPLLHSKIVERPNYLFMVLLFPEYNRATKQIEPHEVDFYITADTLVTVHDSALAVVNENFDACAATAKSKHICLSGTPVTLLVELLRGLLTSLSPMLVHIGRDIDEVEKNIFDAQRKGTILEILRIKTNIANFRKTIGAHKNVISHLVRMSETRFPGEKMHLFLEHLVEQTKEIWDLLDTYKETIDAVHSSHQTILEARLNDVMRVLTMISVIVFPITWIANLFMIPAKDVPIVHGAYGFWIICGLMGLTVIGLITYFKRKRWM